MHVRTLIVVVLLVLVALFAALNWSAFTASTTLSLGFVTIEGPLGLIMLFIVGLLTAVFLVYVVYLQTSFLMQGRRNARELQAQRELAEQAEVSRFTELRSHLDRRLMELENSLAAHLGELRGSLRSGSDSK
jgi:uncharacterized integral membrane protein